MMTQDKSHRINLLKYALIIPIVFIFLFLQNSCKNNDIKQDETNLDIEPQVEKDLNEDDIVVSFTELDQIPVFPGCNGTNEDIKQCFADKIQNFVNENFNTDLANTLNLESGKKRIAVMFTIDKTGHVTNIKSRAPHKALEQEAIRVIKLLPQMTPGEINGEVVNVKYALPIVFVIEGDSIDDKMMNEVINKSENKYEKGSNESGSFVTKNGKQLFYVENDNGSKEYYDRYGTHVDKKGNTLTP